MENIPKVMRSLVAPRKGPASEFVVQDLPTPTITSPKEVLIRVHAAAVSTGDVQMATGQFALLYTPQYPYKIGLEGAGVVVAVGSGVETLKVDDAVYGAVVDKPMFRGPPPGLVSEFAVSEERFLLPKPAHLSFEEAVSMTGSVVTALQTIRRGLQLRGQESLEGQTVFVPAGLSATGSVAMQVAKNVFGAQKIITTVSTAKMPLLEQYLPGVADQTINYQTQKVEDVVARGSVDMMYNTQLTALDQGIPVLNPRTGTLMNIAGAPDKATAREMMGADRFPFWLGLLLDLARLYYAWKLRGTSIEYEMVSGSMHIREDLEWAGKVVAAGKVKAVVDVVDLEDVEVLRERCERVVKSKGGLGKLVIRIRK